MLIPTRPMSRRRLLRSAGGAALALPFLEAMGPSLGSRVLGNDHAADSERTPKRFVAICASLGFHGDHLFPESTGRDYAITPYLEKVQRHRDDFSLFSGLSHPEQNGNNGHASELTWLTAARRPGLAGFRNTISLDQLIAQEIGLKTRFPFLALTTGGQSLSWTSSGVEIPAQHSPAKLFTAMFVDGKPHEVEADLDRLRRGRSVLDTVGSRAQSLKRELGIRDQQKLEEYLHSIRDLESRLQQSEGWVRRPKPVVDEEPVSDINDKALAIERQKLMYRIIALALQTDSTRTVTFQLAGLNSVPQIPGVQSDWHGLSHHGKDPEKIAELKRIEAAEWGAFGEFLDQLKSIEENNQSLLDHTAVMFGSNLGNASAHDWRNLPILLAGGGYRHGEYVAHDAANNTPLCNLYVDLARRMGLEIDAFGSSTATGIKGLESTT
ncbi:DUF1552 domain-containing protein [Rhodopirellula europaea]|uniref:Secreted protein containing DUF1552 n=1 Tax=Rhodopirellula europaea 6C TaxID=1263867 RepID=M2AEW9_9BACT|nr:DUF1552 domain-containing protein [Rhodopirellula europaea]EMB15665.1 secreted protein containing DUF1552 [Rhodopirellula europaea 6C]